MQLEQINLSRLGTIIVRRYWSKNFINRSSVNQELAKKNMYTTLITYMN
mgnify:CR=1 FL=1